MDKNIKSQKKVFVGMSGGVDSSVSAALLKEAGFDVTGVFIKVWHPDWLPCEWKEERRDAMRVAAHLNIPFLTIDLQLEYKKAVVDYLIAEYKAGRTPNPDVMCNKEIKFGSFLTKALEMGADYIATGHYAQVKSLLTPTLSSERRGDLPSLAKEGIEGRMYALLEGKDKNKDQSYFLWTLTQKELKHVLFPVGHLEKSEVRKLAQKFNLPTAEKKDSQGICFIGKVDMKEFLGHYIPSESGNVLSESGEILGKHEGAAFYTIGQRHGFDITTQGTEDSPYYIVDKDTQTNTLTVSHKISLESLKRTGGVFLEDINWIADVPDKKKSYGARIRYRQPHQTCTVIEGNTTMISFSEPQQGVSCGQSVVLYDGEQCLGGGIIKETF